MTIYDEGYQLNGQVYICQLESVAELLLPDSPQVRRVVEFGLNLTGAFVNDESFGLVYAVAAGTANNLFALVDEISLELEYTSPPQPILTLTIPQYNTSGDAFLSVAAGPDGTYILVGDSGRIKRITSQELRDNDDPVDVYFESSTQPPPVGRFTSVVWTGTAFYAAGVGGMLYTAGPDGFVWFPMQTEFHQDILSLAYSKRDRRLLMVGINGLSNSMRLRA